MGIGGNEPGSSTSNADLWTEDLAWQAVRGQALGRQFCTCDDHYHLFWAALRAAGFVGSMSKEEGALAEVLSPLITNQSRILIAAAADPASLCTVMRIAGTRTPHVAVLDKCAAPLKLIDEMCAHKGVSAQTIHSDVLETQEYGKWDIILMHYVTGFIAPESRPRFYAQLASLLSPNGIIVCTYKKTPPAKSADSDTIETAWRESTRKALENSPTALNWEAGELDEKLALAAAGRTARRLHYPSGEDIRNDMIAAGLVLIDETETPRNWTFGGNPKIYAEASSILCARRAR